MSRIDSCLIGVLLLVLAASPTHASRKVDCDKGDSIQAAVDKAHEGQVVEVSGTCAEKVIVSNDRVEIVGLEGTVVIGPPNSWGTFKVRSRDVVIRGFTVEGEVGVRIEQGGSAELRDNKIEGATNSGIYIDGSYGDILYNEVSGSGNFSGIFLFNGASANIVGNTVTNSGGSGIGIEGSSSARVGSNTISNNAGPGISVQENSYIFLEGGRPNTINNNGFGVSCNFSSVIRVDQEQNFMENDGGDLVVGTCEVNNWVGVPFP